MAGEAKSSGPKSSGPTTVEFQNVDIIFGKEPQKALALLDGGATRDDILAATNNVVGVAGASLAIEEGEICVLMGLSGSGKSTLLRAVNGLNKVTRGKVMVRDGSGREGAGVDRTTVGLGTRV